MDTLQQTAETVSREVVALTEQGARAAEETVRRARDTVDNALPIIMTHSVGQWDGASQTRSSHSPPSRRSRQQGSGGSSRHASDFSIVE